MAQWVVEAVCDVCQFTAVADCETQAFFHLFFPRSYLYLFQIFFLFFIKQLFILLLFPASLFSRMHKTQKIRNSLWSRRFFLLSLLRFKLKTNELTEDVYVDGDMSRQESVLTRMFKLTGTCDLTGCVT